MDVVCDRCKTEYEFDDALVSERGTTVKCTNCSHQFKIFRPPTEAESGRAWTLRRPDGTVIPFDSLAVLQKWILEGRVSKMDEIARSGDGWKPLGAIAELETFFSSADSRRTPTNARAVPSRPPGRSLPPLRPPASGPPPTSPVPPRMPSLRAPSSPSTLRPPAPPSQAILKGTAPMSRTFGGTSPGMAPPTSPSAQADGSAPRLPLPDRTPVPAALASPGPVEIAAAEAPRPPVISERAANEPPRLPVEAVRSIPEPPPSARRDLVDDDAPTRSIGVDDLSLPAPPRRGGLALGVAVGLILAGAGAVAMWKTGLLGASPATAAPPTAATAADLTAIHRTAAAYHRGALEDARDALTRMLGARPGDGAVLAARAQVLALQAELARDAAEDHERQADPGAAGAEQRALAAVQRADAARTTDRATADLQAALTAVRAMPEGAARDEAEVSLLDASRSLGLASEVSRLLPRVKARSGASERGALVCALSEPLSDEVVATLRRLAGTGSPRATVALTRALYARGDVAAARAQLEGLRPTAGASDEWAALRSRLASADAGAPSTATLAQAPTAPPAAAPVPTPTPALEPAPAPAPTRTAAVGALPRDYDRLVAEGDRLQNEGRTAAAEERFRAALAARPAGAEALTGMGYVELDRRNYASALARFRAALAANGSFSDAYIGMGEAYASQSRYEQALEAYQRYLSVNPGGSRASMARRQIESLQERVRRPTEDHAPQPSGGESDG